MLKNQIKTTIFLGLLTGLLLIVGQLVAGRVGLVVALIFAGLMNFVSYWFSHKIVLFLYKAKEAEKAKYKKLHEIVEKIARHAGIPKPKVYIVDTPHANAFATGRNPQHAVVACTTGILKLLDDDELEGVLGHEISHVKNRDILISSVAAMIAGVISFIGMMVRWSAIFGGFGGRDDGERGTGILELLVIGILAPIIALLIQLAVSRSREYLADESGAHVTKKPLALASALQKISKSAEHIALAPNASTTATAHLFISNPFRGKNFFNVFSTHPPVEKRVQRLKEMKM